MNKAFYTGNDVTDIIVVVGGVLGLVGCISALLLFILSLPFAFVGFLLLSAVNIFTPITYGYLLCVVVGLVLVFVAKTYLYKL